MLGIYDILVQIRRRIRIPRVRIPNTDQHPAHLTAKNIRIPRIRIPNTAQQPAHLTAVARGGGVPAGRWTPVLPLARRHVQAVAGPVQDHLDLILVRTLTHKKYSYNQSCASGSALIWLSCFPIRIYIGNADPDQGAWKMTKIYK